jgi:hypothetical protein
VRTQARETRCAQEPQPGAWLRLRPHAGAPDADCEELGDMSAALLAELVQRYVDQHASAALEVFVDAASAGASVGARTAAGPPPCCAFYAPAAAS